jgi:sugar phosphate isomerase/epimerase
MALGGSPSHGAPGISPEAVPAGAAAKRRALGLGLMTYNLARSWDIDTIIKNCAEAKFEHAELRTTHAHKVEVGLSPAQRAEVKKRFEDSPIEAISLASAFSYHHTDPAVLRQNIEGTKEYTLLARDIGARGIRVFPNRLLVDRGVPEEKTLEQIGRAVREVGEFARDHGVEIRLSNHGRGTNRVATIRKIFDHAQSEHVYMNWNCDASDVTGAGFEANFNMVKSRIRNLHIHELVGTPYPYRDLFRLLGESGYKGYCDAEIRESEDPVRLMKYYRAVFLAYQGIFE